MSLIKTSILSAIATIIKILSGFVINKFISIYIGPAGLALIGQLQNFIKIVTTFSNGAITQGVIKYLAESDNIEQKQKIISTSIMISLFFSFIISVILILFKNDLSKIILKNIKYSKVFMIFGISIYFYSLNSILLSILNGQKEIKKYIIINIINSVLILGLIYILIIKLNILGALYALVINQSIIFFITLIFVFKSNWFKFGYFTKGVDKEYLKKFSKYSLMTISAAIMVPSSYLILRNYIGTNLGWTQAGYWQGICYISDVYLMFITTSLSIYYLPKLSEIQDKMKLKLEILNGYKIIIPLTLFLSFLIFFFKKYIILIVFNEKFMPMTKLFLWQLIGDNIKIASWLLSYLIIAKAMAKVFIFSEIIFNISFILLGIFFINKYGLIGITYAFSLNYIFYFMFMLYIFYRRFL
jgi:PST family polysaccharide transporter